MQIFSNPDRDISTPKPDPGSYEWWYFDAMSADHRYSFVVIFYEGNPFSRRYIDAIDNATDNLAPDYPAISISIYKGAEPIFYSFEEVTRDSAEFSSEKPAGRVKENHFFRLKREDGDHEYHLELDQVIPNGDRLTGSLTFKSRVKGPFQAESSDHGKAEVSRHGWNLVQPLADVTGELNIEGTTSEQITFNGNGYHDHNTGMEPMKESFDEWYWGRFHFSGHTMVYYLMNRGGRWQNCAWLIDSENNPTEFTGDFNLTDQSLNFFGLSSARKIEMSGEEADFLIQQDSMLDDGPFYQRFRSRLMLKLGDTVYQAKGISEYICPERIYVKLFRPLVNMRIKYPGKTHWVQKSPRLYRWTW